MTGLCLLENSLEFKANKSDGAIQIYGWQSSFSDVKVSHSRRGGLSVLKMLDSD